MNVKWMIIFIWSCRFGVLIIATPDGFDIDDNFNEERSPSLCSESGYFADDDQDTRERILMIDSSELLDLSGIDDPAYRGLLREHYIALDESYMDPQMKFIFRMKVLLHNVQVREAQDRERREQERGDLLHTALTRWWEHNQENGTYREKAVYMGSGILIGAYCMSLLQYMFL